MQSDKTSAVATQTVFTSTKGSFGMTDDSFLFQMYFLCGP